MVSGMRNNYLFYVSKITVAAICAVIMIIIHDYGHALYIKNFSPHSHGISLGFVRFYIVYFMLPSFFLMVLSNNKIFIYMYITIMILMISLWFTTHPLRISLMGMSYSISTSILYVLKYYIEKRAGK